MIHILQDNTEEFTHLPMYTFIAYLCSTLLSAYHKYSDYSCKVHDLKSYVGKCISITISFLFFVLLRTINTVSIYAVHFHKHSDTLIYDGNDLQNVYYLVRNVML